MNSLDRRLLIFLALALLTCWRAMAHAGIDTLRTRAGDMVIVNYDLAVDGDKVTLSFNKSPRFIASKSLKEECGYNLDKLKVIVFEREGDFKKVKFSGVSPRKFTLPSVYDGYEPNPDGFYLLEEASPSFAFTRPAGHNDPLELTTFVAVQIKKGHYKLLYPTNKPLKIVYPKERVSTQQSSRRRTEQSQTETEQIQVTAMGEDDSDLELQALSDIDLTRKLLRSQTELPMSELLQMQILNLQQMSSRLKNPEIKERIKDVVLEYEEKKKELNEQANSIAQAEAAQAKAEAAAEKAEAEAKAKEAEEKAAAEQEKQQKRNLWTIIGAACLAVLGFIGNALFKHHRDVSNNRSMLEMQQSLTRQAEGEAKRRAREVVRNRAHQAANQARNKMRKTIGEKTSGSNKKDDAKPGNSQQAQNNKGKDKGQGGASGGIRSI